MPAELVDDALLPAATHLTDHRALDVVAEAVRAGGGELRSMSPHQVLYRPGRELVVQYTATVSWQRGPEMAETLLAGTTTTGAPSGTMVVRADSDCAEDAPLEVGVWRYPFDPELGGLRDGVVAASVADLLGLERLPELTVVSYRPCRRAVVRARWPGGEAFVKVVPAAETTALAMRHRLLIDDGLPVPEVIAVDATRGLVALRALGGVDLRTQLLAGAGRLPSGHALADLVDQIAEVDLAGMAATARPSLAAAAPRHAAMLRRVLPEAAELLDRLVEAVGHDRPGPMRTVHSDLHEAQVRIDRTGRIVGLLDVDGAGPGEPLDDLARSVGHLCALSFLAGPAADRVGAHAHRVHQQLAPRVGRRELDRRVGAALIGLATGPFRAQLSEWRHETRRVLDEAARWLDVSPRSSAAHVRTLRANSPGSHRVVRELMDDGGLGRPEGRT